MSPRGPNGFDISFNASDRSSWIDYVNALEDYLKREWLSKATRPAALRSLGLLSDGGAGPKNDLAQGRGGPFFTFSFWSSASGEENLCGRSLCTRHSHSSQPEAFFCAGSLCSGWGQPPAEAAWLIYGVFPSISSIPHPSPAPPFRQRTRTPFRWSGTFIV